MKVQVSIIAMAYMLSGAPALAQQAVGAPAAEEESGLQDIVVTAQRRAESMQKVPIAVTAISSKQLTAGGISSSQDIAVATPGLTMTNSRNTVTPYLRGVGTQSGNPASEGSVATYIDGVYIASAAGSIFALNNVERVEVLKGPQGTLFGRNATGGLVQIITRDPSSTMRADLTAGYGNYDTFTGSAYLTGGISDNLAADLAFYGSHQGKGWGKNLFLGNDVNLRREWTMRGKIKADFGDRTSVVLAGDYAWWNSDIGLSRQSRPGSFVQGGFRPRGTIYDVSSALPFINYKSNQWGGSLKVTHDFTDEITLTSTTAYRKYYIRSPLDSDTTPVVLSDALTIEDTNTFQQEFLVSGSSDRFDWVAGVFYFRSDAGVAPRTVFTTAPNVQNANLFTNVVLNSYAAFGQGTYKLGDSTRVTAGVRYTKERRVLHALNIANVGNTSPVGTVLLDSRNLPDSQTHSNQSKMTWRFAVDQQFSDTILGYASFSRGFKAGGYNTSAPTAPAVKPETLDAYEVGFKSDLIDRTLRLNASAFYYNYKNIQLQAIQSFVSVITNAAKGTIKGFEGELVLAPRIDHGSLELRGGISHVHARYKDFLNAQFYTPRNPAVGPQFGGNISSTGDASGNQMIKTPPWSLNGSIAYSLPITESLEAGFDANLAYTSRFFWDPDNRTTQPALTLLNGQIWLGAEGGKWRARLWGKNLLNEQYFLNIGPLTFADPASAAPPRTYGVAVDFKF